MPRCSREGRRIGDRQIGHQIPADPVGPGARSRLPLAPRQSSDGCDGSWTSAQRRRDWGGMRALGGGGAWPSSRRQSDQLEQCEITSTCRRTNRNTRSGWRERRPDTHARTHAIRARPGASRSSSFLIGPIQNLGARIGSAEADDAFAADHPRRLVAH